MKKTTQVLWHVLFFGIILLIPFTYVFVKNKLNNENSENRELAKFPTFTLKEFDEFPSGITAFIDDNFPYKNQAVSAIGLTEFNIFNTSRNEDVIIGKNDYLFFKGEEFNAYNQYKRISPFSQEELEIVADRLNHMKEKVELNNAEFIVFIVPNKERVYSEYMPTKINVADCNTNTEELVDFIRNNTDINIIFCNDAIMNAKEKFGEETSLYYKLDTHWNELGAYTGAKELFSVLNIRTLELDELEIEKTDYSPCDLAGLIGIKSELKNRDYGIEIKNIKDDFETVTEETDGLLEYKNTGKDERRLMFIRDSFTLNMRRFFADNFNYCYLQHVNFYDEAQIDEVKPDVVVYETSERSLRKLLD